MTKSLCKKNLETMNRTLRIMEAEKKKNDFFSAFVEKALREGTDGFESDFSSFFPSLPYVESLVLLMDIDGINGLWDKEQEKKLWRFVVTNIAHEIISKNNKCVSVTDAEGAIVILIGSNGENDKIGYEKLLAKCYKIANIVKEHYPFSVSIALGEIHESIIGFRKSYIDALLAFESRLMFNNTQVVEYVKVNQKK